MGLMDRSYYHDRGTQGGGVLNWLLYGQVPLFNVFGISVRAHSSLIIFLALTLLFGLGPRMPWQDKAISATVLFVIVLLHEFGHCFAARWVGGEAHDIVMHPLGGLAMTSPPPRPLAHFITTAGGPLVNVLICLICGAISWHLFGSLPWNPFIVRSPDVFSTWFDIGRYSLWIYQVSWMLLIFNLLPIYPLDGGRMVQEILWPRIGYQKSMLISCNVGMFAAIIAGGYALVTGAGLLLGIAVFGFITCYQMKRAVLYSGMAGEFSDPTDYSAAYETHPHPRSHRRTRRAVHRAAKRARKLEAQEQAEREKIDLILAKVSAHGMHSLTWWEKRTLHKATERQRKRDEELSRYQ